MTTVEAAREHVGNAVLVRTVNGDVYDLVLTAVTPRGELVLADERGHSTFVALDGVKELHDGRVPCDVCAAKVNRVFLHSPDATQRCAACERKYAWAQPPPKELCEECGTLGAVYSPAYKVWRCVACHAKHRSFTGSTTEAHVVQAQGVACGGADTEDLRHRWFRIKGHRYHCKMCGARRFTDPQLGTIWRNDAP